MSKTNEPPKQHYFISDREAPEPAANHSFQHFPSTNIGSRTLCVCLFFAAFGVKDSALQEDDDHNDDANGADG